MPLPGPDQAKECWPPRWMDPILRRIEIWAAWHSGDPDKLAAVYTGDTAADSTGFFASETGGFKARVRNWVSNVVRYFWGQRSSANRPRRRLHDPVAGDIASASADLLFSEPPTVTVDNEAAQTVLDEIMDEGAHAVLLEGGETASALSGVFLRARWDSEERDTPWFDIVAPDCAVPEWRYGKLVAVTFWKVIARKGDRIIRHLERHEIGRIEHAVYVGSDDALGEQGELAAYDETMDLAEAVNETGTILTGISRLTAEYVPNMKPNRIWRDVPQAAHLGVSDFSGLEGMMDALDLAYSSLIRDVDLGKARLIVPRQYLNNNGRGDGASLDLDREIYEPINAMSEEGGIELKEIQFKIRVDEHERVIQRLKADIVTSAGYSAQTFGLEGDIAVTATEVAAKERRSLTTRDRKTRYWGPALAGILATLLEIAGHTGMDVKVEWPDAVSVDPEAQARTFRELEAARAISIEQKVRERRPDWNDDQVDEEVERIKEEHAIGQAEDPGTFTGGSFDPGGINETIRQSALLANAKRAQSPLREEPEGEA